MRYDNWRELAIECQESGVSVQAWCRKKNIPGTTCRQWLAKISRENDILLLETKQVNQGVDQDSALHVWGRIDLEESVKKKSTTFASDSKRSICLKYHDWSVELNPSFDPDLLKQVMKVLESIC